MTFHKTNLGTAVPSPGSGKSLRIHIGVDAGSGPVHTVVDTAANVSDVTQAGALLHGDETTAHGDAGYRGVHKREEASKPCWHVAMQPGRRRQLDPKRRWAQLLEQAEQLKASIHIGVDASSGLVHTVVGTAANVSDVTQAGALLHGDETTAHGDAGYRGVHKREEASKPCWHVAMQLGRRRQLDPKRRWAQLLEQAEQLKASIRAKVEHPFHVIKNLFRHKKVRYKGLAKNTAQLFSLFGLANLVIAKRSLLAINARGAS